VIRTEVLGLAYGLSEIAMVARKRSSRAKARSHDAGTLRLVWFSIFVGFVAGGWISNSVVTGRFEPGIAQSAAVLALFLSGVALRWWAILVLGRFFTIDVAIHEGHELVTRGPYRFLRHPSYTGVLLVFLALGLTWNHWLALAALVAPVLAALLVRIHIEERALAEQFGDAWREHGARTWRLVPFVW